MSVESEKLLDETGWQILVALQENARASFKELGQQVGLSPPAVADRIRRLEEAGIISGYRVDLNLEKLGLAIAAFIRVSSSGEKCVQFRKVVADLPEVLECHRITGSDHFIIKVAVPSTAHLEQLIDRLVPYGQLTASVVLSSPVTQRQIQSDSVSPQV